VVPCPQPAAWLADTPKIAKMAKTETKAIHFFMAINPLGKT
jgi:hypothetical protein